jgi:hypothetical protein
MSTRLAELEACLVAMVRSSAMLMRALDVARAVDPPDWLIGSGVIRDLVWDRLHGFDRPTTPKDLDLVFFDAAALGEEREQEVQNALAAKAAEIPWDAKNQAAIHLWYPEVFVVAVEPLTSSADAVATWPETATAVAVSLLPDDSVRVVAPCGLDDLFGLVCRRNPRRVTVEEYRRRVATARIEPGGVQAGIPAATPSAL